MSRDQPVNDRQARCRAIIDRISETLDRIDDEHDDYDAEQEAQRRRAAFRIV